MKLVFSILHYNNLEITCQAVEYLQQLKGISQADIVLVDNASPNGSGKILQTKYASARNIHVLLNSINEGFARGNNLGYQYATQKLGGDTIVVMNSDVFIKDKYFIDKLDDLLQRTQAEIIAPQMIGLHGQDQNPFRMRGISYFRAKKIYYYNTLLTVLYRIPIINRLMATLLDQKNKRRKPRQTSCPNGAECIPHGACIIFTSKWTIKEKFAFVPCTFMYFEEDILGEYIHKRNYQACYFSNLSVIHKEDASVDCIASNSIKKRFFIAKCMRDSIRLWLKMYDKR